MRYAMCAKEKAAGTPPADLRRLPVLLYMLATVPSLLFSSCAGIVRPADCSTPTPQFPSRSSSYAGDTAPRKPPPYALPDSRPITAAGVVYVGYAYATPDATTAASGDPAQAQPQYAIAALRARDGLPLWRVLAASATSPLVVANGILIVYSKGVSGAGGLIGLRASDGTSLWHMALSGAGIVTPSGGALYMIESGKVYALRLTDGQMLWQSPVRGGAILVPPVVYGTAVFVAAGNGSVVALQAQTGAIRWTAFPGGSGNGTPLSDVWYIPLAAAAGQLYVTTSGVQGRNPTVLGLNPVDGTSSGYALHLPTDTQALYPVLQAGVFFAFFNPELPPGATPPGPPPTIAAYRMNATGGELLWRVSVQGEIIGATSVAHDAQTVYFAPQLAAAPQQAVSAFRLADGAVLWKQRTLASRSTGIAADEGYLFETGFGEDDTMSGMNNLCHMPPVHQPPKIRALVGTDGSVAWTRALDATLRQDAQASTNERRLPFP